MTYQANPLIMSQRVGYGITETRLLYLGLSFINPKLKNSVYYDEEFFSIHIPTKCLIGLFEHYSQGNGRGYYTAIKKACKVMFNTSIDISEEKNSFSLRHVFSKIDFSPKNGLVMQFDESMAPYLLDLVNKRYTKIAVAYAYRLKSTHSMGILEILLRYGNEVHPTTGVVSCDISVDQLKFHLGLGQDAYQGRFDNFKKRILDKSIQEIYEELGYEVRYDLKRTGRTITDIHFSMEVPQKDDLLSLVIPVAVSDAHEEGRPFDAYQQLLDLGISKKKAQSIVEHYEEAFIEETIRQGRKRLEKGNRVVGSGYWVKAIEENYLKEWENESTIDVGSVPNGFSSIEDMEDYEGFLDSIR